MSTSSTSISVGCPVYISDSDESSDLDDASNCSDYGNKRHAFQVDDGGAMTFAESLEQHIKPQRQSCKTLSEVSTFDSSNDDEEFENTHPNLYKYKPVGFEQLSGPGNQRLRVKFSENSVQVCEFLNFDHVDSL